MEPWRGNVTGRVLDAVGYVETKVYPFTSDDLAERLGIQRAAAGRMLHVMASRGFVRALPHKHGESIRWEPVRRWWQ